MNKLKIKYNYLAVDQHGEHYWIANHPRKELLEYFNRKHTENMYLDSNGESHHIGYVIAGHWLEIFKVQQWR